ncbi:DUF333 domain-containing protein [Candidatus Woesearchaeota archaeon]|nr:DUF333 domain-containing protein [Candidatus Woesearchaeota archaeon]
MRKITAALAIGVLFLLLVSCSGGPQKYMLTKEEAKQERVKEQTGLANPATLHCMNTTGAGWTTKENDAGQYGVCTFSDGSWCEEWAYYRGECQPGMNMTSCEGQFWGKSVCPPDVYPVCAKTGDDPDDWQTFSNACKACLKSEGNAQGYILGECE